MPTELSKPKIAIVSLTCCEGCEFALLDLGQKFLDLAKRVEIDNFRLIKEGGILPPRQARGQNDKGVRKDDKIYDISFIEGSVVTKRNLEVLKKIRKASKMLIVLGNCAQFGGIHKMKNWFGRYRALEKSYKNYKGIANPPIYPISEIVKVDFTIPTCPIDGEEFLKIVYQILAGKKPQIPQNPVCFQCQINGYECLLQNGEICLGPVTLGGCEAICLKSKQACWGCRGLLEEPDVDKFVMNCLLNAHPKKEIEKVLEVFGIKDDWLNQAQKEWQSQRKPTALMVVNRKKPIVKK